jgi:hypothetical protein
VRDSTPSQEKIMNKIVHGIVRGKTIELAEELGVADGREVEVQVTVVPQATNWGEGLKRCAGALAAEWTEDDDRILEEIHRSRKDDSRKEVAE